MLTWIAIGAPTPAALTHKINLAEILLKFNKMLFEAQMTKHGTKRLVWRTNLEALQFSVFAIARASPHDRTFLRLVRKGSLNGHFSGQ
jgi:hypothetical protein